MCACLPEGPKAVDEVPGWRYTSRVQVDLDDDWDDHFHDQCGVFGIWGSEEAANHAYLGLHTLQHRGQESAGIVSSDGSQLFVHRGLGLVQDVFSANTLERLPGDRAIGHVRYSTAGGSHIKNAQPIAIDYSHGSIAVGHNGNLTNADEIRRRLEGQGSIFQTTSDTEVVVHLIARSQERTTADRVADALRQTRGAFSLMVLTPQEMIAVRDPWGFRPLSLGRLKGAYVFASEPVAFELIAAEYIRDVEPGEMVLIDKNGMTSLRPFEREPSKMCIFEYVYFARPDATLGSINVYEARKRMGRALASEDAVRADVVIPVPDSGVPAALGYAEKAGLPFELGLVRSHYIGRTFIEPQSSIRHFGVRLKLSPNRALIQGKRVVVIDDSIVRGTTSRKIVKMLRDAGAREVHLRISSPPTRWPCFYGIDTPSRSELIASSHNIDEIAKYVTADSVGYLSVEALHTAVGGTGYCDACFTGNYPVAFEKPSVRRQLSLVM
jgi:amidophosphoribosyltransferase